MRLRDDYVRRYAEGSFPSNDVVTDVREMARECLALRAEVARLTQERDTALAEMLKWSQDVARLREQNYRRSQSRGKACGP